MRQFHGDAERLDDVDDDYYDLDDKSDNEEFDVRKFHGYAEGLEYIDDDYYDHDNDINEEDFVVRKFPGNAIGLDDVDDYDNEEFDGMRFPGVSKNYERVCSICNLRYKRP